MLMFVDQLHHYMVYYVRLLQVKSIFYQHAPNPSSTVFSPIFLQVCFYVVDMVDMILTWLLDP